MGGRLIDDGQYNHHVWAYRWHITADLDALAYRRLRTHDYGFDVGNLHAIDYRLWLADLPIRRLGVSPRSLHFTDNWTRP